MALDANVLSGNVTIKEGRMTTKGDANVCVISEELAEKNGLKVGDHMRFHPLKAVSYTHLSPAAVIKKAHLPGVQSM